MLTITLPGNKAVRTGIEPVATDRQSVMLAVTPTNQFCIADRTRTCSLSVPGGVSNQLECCYVLYAKQFWKSAPLHLTGYAYFPPLHYNIISTDVLQGAIHSPAHSHRCCYPLHHFCCWSFLKRNERSTQQQSVSFYPPFFHRTRKPGRFLRPGFALPLHNFLCMDTIRSLMNKINHITIGHTIPVWLQ